MRTSMHSRSSGRLSEFITKTEHQAMTYMAMQKYFPARCEALTERPAERHISVFSPPASNLASSPSLYSTLAPPVRALLPISRRYEEEGGRAGELYSQSYTLGQLVDDFEPALRRRSLVDAATAATATHAVPRRPQRPSHPILVAPRHIVVIFTVMFVSSDETCKLQNAPVSHKNIIKNLAFCASQPQKHY